MPHWIALLAIVICAWMVLAVVGGWLIGQGLALLERDRVRRLVETRESERGAAPPERRAA